MPAWERLIIPQAILDAVAAQAKAEQPNECCGILAGLIHDRAGTATHAFPVRNDRASPREYLTNPRDLLEAMKAARLAGVEWLAVYHSHPTSPARPSQTDLASNTYGETLAHLIVGLAGEEPEIRGWWLRETDYEEVEVLRAQ